ncbi:MAG: UDP-N-acetylglucosamine-N-acetylmuramyl-(pentapeptide) pyrophosphoryl-undecaprenol [Sediminibacterium sp.]|nr:UDP-N-acetylglucosamine-N-acetylmuramyl-(pentapeptide) pyrophosphoryl-undecaprenol [Sediminibacterium sp.]
MNFNIQKVLVAPLDWGLGHATRCIPIIRALVAKGYQVVLAAEGTQAILLQQEFPSLVCLPLPGYRVRYSKQAAWLPFTLTGQLPRLIRTIQQEHRWLEKTITEYSIDLVISDNRYGLSSTKVPCIFITHQLTIKAPFVWLEKMLQRINYHYINGFAACWVPDAEGMPNAAGVLSHPVTLPKTKLQYMGLLSRFRRQEQPEKYDLCILLSGPEPQRTLLEKKVLAGLSTVRGKVLLVRGKPGSTEDVTVPANTEVKNHLPGDALQAALLQSRYIISRSGYTTIMELLSLQKAAILIPTPGQTEQEYLAETLQQRGVCLSVSQDEFDLDRHLSLAKKFPYQFPALPVFAPDTIEALLKASI